MLRAPKKLGGSARGGAKAITPQTEPPYEHFERTASCQRCRGGWRVDHLTATRGLARRVRSGAGREPSGRQLVVVVARQVSSVARQPDPTTKISHKYNVLLAG